MDKAEEFFETVAGSYIEIIALDEVEKDAVFKFAEQYAQQASNPLIELLKVAHCPNCAGDGVIWLNENAIEQCQWCDEQNELISNYQNKQ